MNQFKIITLDGKINKLVPLLIIKPTKTNDGVEFKILAQCYNIDNCFTKYSYYKNKLDKNTPLLIVNSHVSELVYNSRICDNIKEFLYGEKIIL